VVKRAAVWTVVLGAIWAVIAAVVWGRAMALGVVAGAAIGGVNNFLLGRAVSKILANPDEHRKSKRKIPGPLLLKWPLLLGMLALVMLYLPVRPEGVAIGALISLVSLAIAGLESREK
jgi:membrane protein YqaA with SNARE-associated domain